jgi:GNAT superfamily N-acetyltransferase
VSDEVRSFQVVDGKTEPVAELCRVMRAADWAADRTDADIARSFAGTTVLVSAWAGERCLGVFRVISDGVFRAMIEDVVVDPDARGQGIGRAMVQHALAHPAVAEVEEWSLFTEVPDFWLRMGFEPGGGAMKKFARAPNAH